MKNSFDVVILGGGPAGTAAALTLKKRDDDLSIALIESSHYDTWRVGETLSPDAGKAFRELDLWESFMESEPLPALGSCAAWETESIEENEFIFHPEGKGWHLNRVEFDHWMAKEAMDKGVELFKGTSYVSHKKVLEGFSLILKSENRKHQVKARFIVDALGRMSPFGKAENVKKQMYDRLSGWVGFFSPHSAISPIRNYTLVEAVKSGWWYSARLNDEQMVIAYMTDTDILKNEGTLDSINFQKLLAQSIHTKKRIIETEPIRMLKVLSASSMRSESVTGDHWIAVGDAASTFDPLSSQGIYKSIRSGMFAAYAISDFIHGNQTSFQKYQRFIIEEYKEYLQNQKLFYHRVKKWPASVFWLRRNENKYLSEV